MMIGIPIQCHSTNLQYAFGMDTTTQFIENSLAKFIVRLYDNAYTLELLKYTIDNKIKNSMSDKFFNYYEIKESN
jgi:hypothetical protein